MHYEPPKQQWWWYGITWIHSSSSVTNCDINFVWCRWAAFLIRVDPWLQLLECTNTERIRIRIRIHIHIRFATRTRILVRSYHYIVRCSSGGYLLSVCPWISSLALAFPTQTDDLLAGHNQDAAKNCWRHADLTRLCCVYHDRSAPCTVCRLSSHDITIL